MPLRSHKQKRMRQIKKLMQRGLLDPEKEDPFSLFVASTNIRYCFYHETHKILGQTFGMCVLQVRQHAQSKIMPPYSAVRCAGIGSCRSA